MTVIVIVVCLVILASIISGGIIVQYRRYRKKYEAVARAIYDPASWRIGFQLRTLVLSGRIGGHRACYSIVGDERKMEPVSTYLLLEHPVKRNFRFYSGSDPDQTDPEIREALAQLQEIADFRGLLVTSEGTPFLARLIARPLGFGYRPGLLLWKWSRTVFDPDTIKRDFTLLLQLAEQGI